MLQVASSTTLIHLHPHGPTTYHHDAEQKGIHYQHQQLGQRGLMSPVLTLKAMAFPGLGAFNKFP